MIESKIIIVDDDQALTSLLKKVFEDEGFMTITYNNTDEGYKKILKSKPDLVIVDIKMPRVGGLELTRMLRKNPVTENIPIIMLTVESTEMCKVVGLENGADDYVTKPFSNRELVARAKSLLRRVRRKDGVKKLEHDGLVMLLDSRTVTLNKKQISMRPKEFDLLYILMSKPNIVLNREFILENVFEYNAAVTTRTIDTHIKNLRHLLGPWSEHIMTVFGLGFKFVPSSK
ncbi:MAG: response regulator transcription factor [Endomicrobium sp.]|jgi:DNA-binding response OmpR family regulator|uniref:response regulator transcription factor n=1 Tax=Candidatus Endomicrobiellum cubanum TaxID=3242325 RepID=UPI002821CAD2|nr:response regulator transcription factor [Endomicrobium sp.]